ncbi:MAG: hypothetical protein HS111_33470 [Kofleriaceae bacterium]|nr:hypothetical protein [Kofleriaceae bacterium]
MAAGGGEPDGADAYLGHRRQNGPTGSRRRGSDVERAGGDDASAKRQRSESDRRDRFAGDRRSARAPSTCGRIVQEMRRRRAPADRSMADRDTPAALALAGARRPADGLRRRPAAMTLASIDRVRNAVGRRAPASGRLAFDGRESAARGFADSLRSRRSADRRQADRRDGLADSFPASDRGR